MSATDWCLDGLNSRRMADQPYSDEETHARLMRAREALGDGDGASEPSRTALLTARKLLSALTLGLVETMYDDPIPPASEPRQKRP